MKRIYRRKFAWGTLRIKADFSKASDGIMCSTEDLADDEQTWQSTPFQVASFGHSKDRALSAINRWLKGQAG